MFVLPMLLAASMTFVPLDNPRLSLWYEAPATNWNEALPIGNGRLGAMVFGGVHEERVQLNDDTLWAGHAQDRHNPQALQALPEVRRLIFEGKNEEASKLASETMMGVPPTVQSYQTLGDVHLSQKLAGQATQYRRWLNLDTAVTGCEFTVGDTTFRREVFSSHPDKVIAIRLTAMGSSKIELEVSLDRPENFSTTAFGSDGLAMSGRAGSDGVLYDVLLRAKSDGQVESTNRRLKITGSKEVLLFLTSSTDYNFKEPSRPLSHDRKATCEAVLTRALSKSFKRLQVDHIRDYQSLFQRVSLELGTPKQDALPTDQRLSAVRRGTSDPGLAALYFQFGRYLTISCSRPGDMPANLQGLWCADLAAPWNADYHTNINLQMNYWPTEVANLSECQMPLFDLMDLLARSGEETARQHYGAGGWVVHHLSDVWGFTVPADGVWGIWPVGGAWLALHPWEHYQFTRDRSFLRKRGFPLMKGAAQFMLDFLVVAPASSSVAGKLVTNPSHSPENSFRKQDGTVSQFTYASTMDLEIAHELFTNCLAAIDVLADKKSDYESEFRSRLIHALAELAPLQVSPKTGRLQEWVEDYDEPEPGHRHMSHLFGVHPGSEITLDGTPALAKAAKKSLEYRLSHGGGHTGWSRAWIVNFWARLCEPELAHEHLTELLAQSTLPNLFDNHPPFQIDGNFGGCAGIAEMLVQSHTNRIVLLPALPRAWDTGAVKGLRCRGGFEIGFSWSAGKIVNFELKNISGDEVCSLRLPLGSTVFGHGRSNELTVHVARGRSAKFKVSH